MRKLMILTIAMFAFACEEPKKTEPETDKPEATKKTEGDKGDKPEGDDKATAEADEDEEIGRASCRERV